jgi:cellulose synthase/poly-beta-1,6-N-acetylglucosamine synthase-like glycosyltransferase
VIVIAIVFWTVVGLLLFGQVGYPLMLASIAGCRWMAAQLLRRRRTRRGGEAPASEAAAGEAAAGEAAAGEAAGEAALPFVSVIIPAYAEESVIGARVVNLRGLDYPVERFEVIVSCDGTPDRTADRARVAGADLVLERPREGKVRAQDAAVAAAKGQVLAFGDANSAWDSGALRALVRALTDPRVGYVCGDVKFVNEGGTNQEGVYWRYEMMLRRLESNLCSVTAGNGAIYATRRETYIHVDPVMGHDLSFPFNMVKRGWRAVYAPDAMATEKMVPSLEGEFARKRRFMGHTWPIVVKGGLLSPRGYSPMYALMIFSHRVLRYLSPALHTVALAANIALITSGPVYIATAALQLAVLAAAALAAVAPIRPFLILRYYVLSTASVAAGLWDWLRDGTSAGWEPVQEIR